MKKIITPWGRSYIARASLYLLGVEQRNPHAKSILNEIRHNLRTEGKIYFNELDEETQYTVAEKLRGCITH